MKYAQNIKVIGHTPGPWAVNATPFSSNQNFVVLGNTGAHKKRVCAIYSDHDEADARLIAAAPELLACLDDIVRSILYDAVTLHSLTPQGRQRLDRAKAAIAKATE